MAIILHLYNRETSREKYEYRMQGCVFFWGGGGGGERGDLTDDLRMYMRRCHAYILVNKSHNNAVITNDFFLLVYVIMLFVLYILHVYYYGILGGGGGGRSQCAPPPPLYATLRMAGYFRAKSEKALKLIFMVLNFTAATSPGAWYCCTSNDIIDTRACNLLYY